MASKRRLERRLADLAGFPDPDVRLEQYPTPADLAATILHRADLNGDLEGTVVDLGTGTGILGIGAALAEAPRVIGLEIDPDAIGVARRNERASNTQIDIEWLLGDAHQAPLCPTEPVTILANPPFGAQHESAGDRGFLETAARLGGVSYSIHNTGSRGFVEAFAADNGGQVTEAYAAEIDLDRRFPFHTEDKLTIPVEVFRIEWAQR